MRVVPLAALAPLDAQIETLHVLAVEARHRVLGRLLRIKFDESVGSLAKKNNQIRLAVTFSLEKGVLLFRSKFAVDYGMSMSSVRVTYMAFDVATAEALELILELK